ncbi:MAG: YigZ family protein [Oscillospiraceae bacterium]
MDFNTIYGEAHCSFFEKKSEFIGHISPAKTADEAVAFIEKIRSENRKATHNVYAYLLRNGHSSRYSDDSEPQGTAGVPVLDVIKKTELTDVCIVVTRYFGGVLLGAGGLVRAYSHAASIAINSAQIMIMRACFRLDFSIEYNLFDKISHLLPDYEIKLISTDFGSGVEISLLVKADLCNDLCQKLVDITNGRINICKSDELFEDFG